VEPAAVLIASLEVELRRRPQLRPSFEHGRVAHTGIEPYVEDVLFLAKLGRAAFRAAQSVRHQLAGRPIEPGVRAFALEDRGDVVRDGFGDEHVVAARTEERDDRYAPIPLPRDAPIRARLHHAANSLSPPRRNPSNAIDLLEDAPAQLVRLHRDEPLLGRAEDHRILASPAVRIAVLHALRREKPPRFAEPGDDRRVGVEDALAREALDVVREAAAGIDRRVDRETVPKTDLVVFLPVSRRGVDESRSGVERRMLAEDDDGIAIDPGVAGARILERRTGEFREHARFGRADLAQERLE
jgi:hypothetical protein